MTTTALALDLGTNTFLMLVARGGHDRNLVVVQDHCRTPRLGEGLARSGELSPAAMARGLEVLREFRALADASGVSDAPRRVTATAAMRKARNAAEFIERVQSAVGWRIEVIDGAEEARLGYGAVAWEYGSDVGVIDVGGGSTEITLPTGRRRASANVGAVVLTERHQGHLAGAAWSDAAWDALRADCREAIAALDVGASPRGEWVVLGGTGANLACADICAPRFDAVGSEGRRVERAAVLRLAEALRKEVPSQRALRPLEPERLAILPAGLACLEAALERVGAQSFRVSGRGLRYGVARELLFGG